MTAAMLLRALCDFLRGLLVEYAAAKGDDGRFTPPQVFEWYLPFKNPKAPEKIDFPYVVARVVSGEDSRDLNVGSTVQVKLFFGVYDEGERVDGLLHPTGAYDLINLMEHVRIGLQRQQVIGNRFRIEMPYKWSIPEEQPYPLWVGEATTIWTVQSVTEQMTGGVIHAFPWE